MALPDLISLLPLLMTLGLPVVGIVWGLSQAVFELFANARKHEPSTNLDRHLPLCGRWLRYAVAVLLLILGCLAITILLFVGYLAVRFVLSRG
jgi:hypothetical protein